MICSTGFRQKAGERCEKVCQYKIRSNETINRTRGKVIGRVMVLVLTISTFAAKANRGASNSTSDAEVCCLVWWQHVSITGRSHV